MARKVGQIIAPGDRRWLIRVVRSSPLELNWVPRFAPTLEKPSYI